MFTYFQSFFKYFSIITYVKLTSWTIYVALCILIFLVLFIMITVLIMVQLASSRLNRDTLSPKSLVYTTIKLFLALSTTFLFIPINELLISVFSCHLKNNEEVNNIFEDVKCWTIAHIIIGIINSITLVTFLTISYITALIYFESSITTSTSISK